MERFLPITAKIERFLKKTEKCENNMIFVEKQQK
ncbi:hypothetical protein T06_15149 [Trichinella sp. T6]|nr:hypothetical protein T06_15149 [Trichinella sp. T6]